jgi:hypothetical protein
MNAANAPLIKNNTGHADIRSRDFAAIIEGLISPHPENGK